jgi:hypothetical protein
MCYYWGSCNKSQVTHIVIPFRGHLLLVAPRLSFDCLLMLLILSSIYSAKQEREIFSKSRIQSDVSLK